MSRENWEPIEWDAVELSQDDDSWCRHWFHLRLLLECEPVNWGRKRTRHRVAIDGARRLRMTISRAGDWQVVSVSTTVLLLLVVRFGFPPCLCCCRRERKHENGSE